MIVKKGNNKNSIEEHSNYKLFATCFGIGQNPNIPGTLGSLLALPIWLLVTSIFQIFLLPSIFMYVFWFFVFFIIYIFGAKTANYIMEKTHVKDPKSVIIDETLGQLITLVGTQHLILNPSIMNQALISGTLPSLQYYSIYFILNLALFRLFDLVKPALVVVMDDRIKGGNGIMFDDVVAGIITAIFINLLYLLTIVHHFI
jgi:phosphatidylglycerophosphatase A